MMNIEEQKSAIRGMKIPELVRLYPMAAADQKFLILGEIDRQKKVAAEDAIKQGQNERSVEQDIMQEATGIAAAQNMINRPVSEMETVSRYAGIPTQLVENQPEMAPEELMAAGGVASLDAGRMDLAEGGIIAFQDGGNIVSPLLMSDPNARPYTGGRSRFGRWVENTFNTNSSRKTPEERQTELSKYMMQLDNEYKDKIVRNPFKTLSETELLQQDALRAEREQKIRDKQIELGLIQEDKVTPEVMTEVKSPALKDIDATSEIDKDLADKTKEVESMSIFDQVKAPDIDSLYEQEDLTGVAEREAERYKEMLGEDEVTKEARDRLAKRQERIAEREGALSGEALATAGFKMMQSKSPFFLQAAGEAGEEGLKAFTEGKREINKLKDASDQLSMDINKIERAEKTAATKFGLESEERRRLANEKTNLMKNKAKLDMYNTEINTKLAEKKINALEKSYAASGASAKARMAETIRKAKQSVMESIPYQNEVTQINKKYKGRENSPEYQLELDRAYKKYLAMALPDEVYTAGDAYADVKSQFDTTAEQALAADI